ncbi:MAG: hypothetical protein U0X40_01765 [Ferruginibacter sp.]
MKAIIYAGAILFGAASVYGITDYFAASRKGQLEHLYKDEPAPSVATEVKKTASPVTITEQSKTGNKIPVTVKPAAKKTKVEKRDINLDEFSRARIPEPELILETKMEEPVKPAEIKVSAGAAATAPAEATAEAKQTTLPKISSKMFSRAPLRNETGKQKKD